MAPRIKQLFVSYSRDDKHWTYEFAKSLREDLTYSAFVDYRNIHIGADWWRTICENIEACDCAIYIMTPKSVESLYCRAEIDYLLALNKPILPIMLKSCTFPDSLSRKRVQYLTISDEMQIDRVLLELQKGLTEVQYLLYDGEYNAPSPLPVRPDEPKPKDTKSAEEVFDLAAEAAEERQLEQAESLFAEVIKADSGGRLGRRAQHRLDELRSYMQVARRAARPATLRDARELWREHCESHGREFDPKNLASILDRPSAPPRPAHPSSLDLMPAPFAWIEIPGKGYSIARYPITNAQYAKFIEAGGYRESKWWTEAGWKTREEGWHYDGSWKPSGKAWTEPRYWKDAKWNGAEHPVVGVSWYESVAFCLWLSEVTGEKIMLPTEDQWQYAAQGDDGRDYPWGPKWDASRCNNNIDQKGIGKTTPVQQYKGKGDSPFGVIDMAGNVWEWCLTDYDAKSNNINSTATFLVLRGGSWQDVRTDYFRCDRRTWWNPYRGSDRFGFRVSRS